MGNEIQQYTGDRQSTVSLVLDSQSMEKMMALAEVMATGVATVPRHLQKNKADCLAVIMQAMQWKMNPFAVAQKTHLVSGTLGYEAQLVNSVINTAAPTKDRLNYEWYGDWSKVIGKFKEVTSKSKTDPDTGKPITYRVPDWMMSDEKGLGVKVWATMKGEDEPRVLDLGLAQCRVRNSPLWADDPRQQIAYLAVKRWSRLHCPDVIMGVYTPEELSEIDITPLGQTVTGAASQSEPDEPHEPDLLDDKQVQALREAIANSGATEAAFCTHARIGCIDDLEPSRYEAAMKSLAVKAKKLKEAKEAEAVDAEAAEQ